MFFKVEPTGCCEREGYVQVRFDFFLDVLDAKYSDKYVQVPERGLTEEEKASGKKIDIPLIWVNCPFHTHFIYVTPTTINAEIMDIGENLLKEAYEKWSADQFIDIRNAPLSAVSKTSERLSTCIAKVDEIKSTTMQRTVVVR